MADEELRRARRRFEETGAFDDEAAWLLASSRAGALTPERLLLAARLGHAAARQLRDDDPAPVGLLELLRHEDPELRLRCWLPVGWRVLTRHRDGRFDRMWADLELGLVAGRQTPGRSYTLEATAASDALHLASRLARGALFEARPALRPPPIAERYAGRGLPADLLAELAAENDPVAGPPSEETALLALAELERAVAPPALLDVVRAELVPWLLGVADPVRARVALA